MPEMPRRSYKVLVRTTHTGPKVHCAILNLDQLLGVQLRGCSTPHPDATGNCENNLALGHALWIMLSVPRKSCELTLYKI
jgi:hypothetical protein